MFFIDPPAGYDAGQVDPGFFQRPPEGYDPSAIDPGFRISIDSSKFDTEGTDFTPILGDALPYTTGIAASDSDTRSEWQKWKDSFKRDWAVRE